ncbi:MAG: hypothetical protein O7G87_12565 [bacterium]|nr:hypothetical protein [bacterium]
MKQIQHLLLCVFCVLTGCQGSDSGQEAVSDRVRAEAHLKAGRYQEAAWAFFRAEDTVRAEAVLDRLEGILESSPVLVEAWVGMGISENYIATFSDSVRGFFKVAASDPEGPVEREVAVYRLDRLLGFGMTPMTLMRTLRLPDGRTVKGSLNYFVVGAKTADALGLKTVDQPDGLIFLDAVIGNSDRHVGNWMIDGDTGDVIAIDHNRTFYHELGWTWWKRVQTVGDPSSIRVIYHRLKTLPETAFKEALDGWIDPAQYQAFWNARKVMISYLDGRIEDLK